LPAGDDALVPRAKPEAQILMHYEAVYPLSDYAADHAGLLRAIAQNDPAAPERLRDPSPLGGADRGEIARRSAPANKTTVPTGGQVR